MGIIYKLIAQNLSFFIHEWEDNKFYATLQLKGKMDLKSPFFNTAEECRDHLKDRIDEQQYADVICGDVTSEFVDEYIYLYGEK